MLIQEKPTHVVATALLIIAVEVIVFVEYFGVPKRIQPAIQNGIACTQEAKLCPDGSYVGRIGPDCAFAACQTLSVGQEEWQTYRNEEYGFEFRYPTGWGDIEFLTGVADNNYPYLGCAVMGVWVRGSFSKNSHVGFGAQSTDFNDCSWGRGGVIEDYIHKIEIKNNNLVVGAEQTLIEDIIKTNAGTNAYLFKNYKCEGCDGNMAGVVELLSTTNNVQVIIFETGHKGHAGVAVLDQILSTFKFIE
jgi:hypothetical protein